MQKIKAFLFHPITISIIGLLAISCIIWFAGPQIKFGADNSAPLAAASVRLVCIMVVLVLWGLNNLRIQSKNSKSNSQLVSGLKDAQESAPQQNDDQAAEEMYLIRERFEQALDTLKRYKFKGVHGKKALYELPWYIIVGPPGSGKTTALVNSGLEFPLADQFGAASLQGVGGTRNCDWWFTNDAVMIDTAGRYTTQDSHKVVDSAAWEGFLDLLKKNRRRRPINGAIVAISLQDLLMQTEDERAMHAKTIRSRLDELMDKLQIRFPVYLMFTKSDLVSGFTEFFEDLGKEEREQVWGVSLPDAPAVDTPPDFDYLRSELTRLSQLIYNRVLWRMHNERDSRRRAAIQGFPQQFENLKILAEQFVQQAFSFNRFKFQPYLRGVYFSSGTQDGTPIDRLMASVSANFGFGREVGEQSFQQGKSYFIGRLFREVIFPEAELVGSNTRYENTIRWLQRGAYVAMLGSLIGLSVIWTGSVMNHRGLMSKVQDRLAEYRGAEQKLPSRVGGGNGDVRRILPSLDALRSAAAVYDGSSHNFLNYMGLYDKRVDGQADEAYHQQLQVQLLPRLIDTLEQELGLGYQGRDLYDTFRIYMMFKKTDKMEIERIEEWFELHWEQALHGEGSRRKQLQTHLQELLQLTWPAQELNPRIVKDTRHLIRGQAVAQRVYSRVRSNPVYARKTDLLSLFGSGVRTSFDMTESAQKALQVPFMFTKEGYDELNLSAGSELVADIVNDRWVLTDDDSDRLDFIEEDMDEVSEQVQALYLKEYVEVWDDIYKNLDVVEFRSLRHGEEVLANMVDVVYSPLLSVLEIGRFNTQLKPPKLAVEKAAGKVPPKGRVGRMAASALLSQYEGTAVDKHFHEVNTLVGDGDAPIQGIMKKVQTLHEFMADVAQAPDPSQQAFGLAKARFEGGSNAITSLRAYAQSLPNPVRDWLEDLCDQSWKVVLGSASEYVESEWEALVYRPYSQGLQGRYPLKRSASDEITLYEFSEFFKPGGTMDSFFEGMIKPFVNTRGQWRNRVVDRYSLGLSGSALQQINNAQKIKDIFYRESPDSIAVTLELKPRAMDEHDARFLLDVGDERLIYQHGPKFWQTVRWQANQDNMRVYMKFEDTQGASYDREFHGVWAWFRLLDSSYVEKTGQSTTYLVTFSAGSERGTQRNAHKMTYEVKTKSIDNPFRREVLDHFTCPESIR